MSKIRGAIADWSAEHLKTVFIFAAVLTLLATPATAASKVHTEGLALTCAVATKAPWCSHVITTPAPTPAAAAVTR